jgi:PST family polysaccharide transporter
MARIGHNALVTLVLQWGKYLVQVLTLVVLSHLLSPHDYGLVAMVLTVSGLAAVLGDLGLSLAALQAPTLTQAQKSNLFWLNGLLGVLVAGAVAASAGLLAAFYGEPALVGITFGLASVFALNGFAVQLKVDVNRKQRFVALGMIDLSGQVVGLVVAVGAAVAGAGYWSLVLQQVVGSATGLIAAALISRWRPSLPSRRAEMSAMLRFGRDTLGLHIANYVTTTIDSVVVGRQFGPSLLGLYNRAFQLVVLPLDQVLAPLTRVFIPRLSQLTEDDPFNDALGRLQRVVVYGIVGPLGLLAVVATPLLEVVLGPQWTGAGGLVRLLVLGGVFQALGYVYYWAFLARQRTRELFFSELWGRVPMIVLILALVHLGVAWVALSVAFGQALIWLASTVWFAPRLGVRPKPLLRVVVRPLVLFAIATAVGLVVDATLVGDLAAPLHLLVLVAVWAGVVGLGLLASRANRDDIRMIIASVRPVRA